MHIIVVNDKDLSIDGSQSNSGNNKYTGQMTASDAPTLLIDGKIVDHKNNKPVKKKKSIPEMIPAFGIILSIFSVFCFSVASLVVKVLKEIHSLEILFVRCSFQLAFYIIPVIYNRYPLFGIPGHRIDLVIRAFCGTSAAICLFMAYHLIPLADATTIQFTAPVMVIFLAFFILKEPLTILQIGTGVITLFGVIIIAKPEFIFGSESSGVPEGRTEGLIFSTIGMFSTASVMIILRRLKTTPISVVICWFSIVAILASSIILTILDKWMWPTELRQFALLFGIGILGISDQFFMTIALHYESAGPVALTRTLNIVLAFVWDVLVLSEEFDWTSIVGAVLVTTCIAILGVSRWKYEKPAQFQQMKEKCCSSCYPKEDDEECEILIVRKQSQPYYDSIDDKGISPSVLKPMERNDSCLSFRSNNEITVDKNNR